MAKEPGGLGVVPFGAAFNWLANCAHSLISLSRRWFRLAANPRIIKFALQRQVLSKWQFTEGCEPYKLAWLSLGRFGVVCFLTKEAPRRLSLSIGVIGSKGYAFLQQVAYDVSLKDATKIGFSVLRELHQTRAEGEYVQPCDEYRVVLGRKRWRDCAFGNSAGTFD